MAEVGVMIRVKPRLSDAALQEMFQRAERYRDRTIDGRVLACLLRLSFHMGLTKGELRLLEIRDVLGDDGNVRDEINLGHSRLVVPEDVKAMLHAHLIYLEETPGYRTLRTSPLFPEKKPQKANANRFYKKRTLTKHLRKVLGGGRHLDDLRQSGICRFFSALRSEGFPEKECLRKTETFSRLSRDYLIDRLEGRDHRAHGYYIPRGSRPIWGVDNDDD